MKKNKTLLIYQVCQNQVENGVALQWFENYLSDRRIVTKVNDTLSDEKVLTHGVPQGSVGPVVVRYIHQ